jgi:hypothetical protein
MVNCKKSMKKDYLNKFGMVSPCKKKERKKKKEEEETSKFMNAGSNN